MRSFINLQFPLLFISIVSFFGCKPKAPDTISPEADTRLWVKKTYDAMDPMNVPASINSRRLEVIKVQFDQATDLGMKINLGLGYAMELLNCNKNREAIQMITSIYDAINANKIPIDSATLRNQYALLAMAYMRLGEVENCLQNHNHESCFIPVQGGGVHKLREGSHNAIQVFQQCLKIFPNDLESKYLINIAYQTLGMYPDSVPKEYLIDPKWFQNKHSFPRFKDVAPHLGVNTYGLAGGCVVDDFNNDGWLDIVATSWSPNEELVFYLNQGDGTYRDATAEQNLKGHTAILNLNQTDFNNDGLLDLFLMRGAWLHESGDVPNTLLKNTGNGFVDVTYGSGLDHVAPTQTSAWADYNLDGWLDVIIANESKPNFDRGVDVYINNKNGTFTHASAQYGLQMNHYFKACVATDINNDKYADIYFSIIDHDNLLFINEGMAGKNSFRPAGPEVNVGEPLASFPCWSFDFDNNGYEDIFVSGYANQGTPATHWMLSHMGKADPAQLPKLYRNDGNMNIVEVGQEMGLTEVAFTMGCNFGDINVDGYLDFYLATGNPLYQSIVPNKMYLNMAGKRFEDVSYSGGFANIQKGHGVGFGDIDHDGDEDFYVVIGGAYDGDGFYNCLFENPNHEQNNWVILKPEGKKANAAAIGARVKVTVTENGQQRHIHRTVTSGASFGGNSLILEVGLGKASQINEVVVQWPCTQCPDNTYTDVQINQAYRLVQDEAKAKKLTYKAADKSKQSKGHEHHH